MKCQESFKATLPPSKHTAFRISAIFLRVRETSLERSVNWRVGRTVRCQSSGAFPFSLSRNLELERCDPRPFWTAWGMGAELSLCPAVECPPLSCTSHFGQRFQVWGGGRVQRGLLYSSLLRIPDSNDWWKRRWDWRSAKMNLVLVY